MCDEERPALTDDRSKFANVKASVDRWANTNTCWTQSEEYGSSGTTTSSTSEEDEELQQQKQEEVENCSENFHASTSNVSDQYHLANHINSCTIKPQGCLCQSCLLGLARVIALHGSLPNICAAASASQPVNLSFCNSACTSAHLEFARHASSKEIHCGGFGCPSFGNQKFCSNNCCLAARAGVGQLSAMYGSFASSSTCAAAAAAAAAANAASPSFVSEINGNNCLERRKKRFKNKTERRHKIKSQSDLINCEKKNKPHYCSLQHFHCPNEKRPCSNSEERLKKLENERSSLHMEIAILSEQLDAQSSKIVELESALKEKNQALRLIEESLQKEVLLRSSLETEKLKLVSSMSEMKLIQANLEHENLALRSSAAYLTNSERFSRHAGHYSSLPRPPTSAKKGVAFAVKDETIDADGSRSAYFKSAPPAKPFSQLSIEEVGDWLANLGLESYTNELKRWGATGTKLLDASVNQLEKELDIKNVMHRKKLIYAIESARCNGDGYFGSEKMDTAAVLRWLDDIGLPQHKEAFFSAKVDGRVLHRLTTEDLFSLNITAQLHAASLRRGIQVLRELNFAFDNLERRSAGSNPADANEGSSVALWTNHRVMEWLKVIDLAEYAPNMRGSGVHGGLLVYEHRFNSELLASLLSIPPSKTLLRRHLNTHFNEIVGRDVVQLKRQAENTLGFAPLTLTARLKTPKRTQFTLKRKKSKNEVDFGNLVCPLTQDSAPGTPSTSPGSSNLNSPTF